MDIEKAIEKIGDQFPHTPEANLCLAVIDRALKDLTDPQVTQEDKQDAIEYLSGDILHAQLYGVSSGLVKSILAEASFMPSEWALKKRGEAV